MNENHPRLLTALSPEWSMPQVEEALARALDGAGPALAMAPVSCTNVPAEIAVVVPTSGSTGQPKEVAFTSAALSASAQAAHDFLGALPGERWSLLLPINHIAGVNVLVRARALGNPVLGINDAVQYTAIVPTQLHRALNGDHQLLAHLQACKAVLVGGAAASAELLESAHLTNINIVTTYGMSEMSGGCIYNNRALDGVDVRISAAGNIQLRGSMMASGYLNDSDSWKRATSDGWFTTSDLGELVDGEVRVIGRSDDQIISGGEKISLDAIEKFLNAEFNNQEFIACGVSDPEWGTKLIVLSNQRIEMESLRDKVRAELGGHAVPKGLLVVADLPRTSLGKPDRVAARDLYLAAN
jgi:O-succinylbenzoic acid--CoA ligase